MIPLLVRVDVVTVSRSVGKYSPEIVVTPERVVTINIRFAGAAVVRVAGHTGKTLGPPIRSHLEATRDVWLIVRLRFVIVVFAR